MQNFILKQRVLSLISLLLIFLGVGLVFNGLGMIVERGGGKVERVEEVKEVKGIGGEVGRVVKVIDGDTVEIQLGEGVVKLRYIGVDTPETVDPRRPVGCFGKEASLENKKLVEGKEVILQKDISETDKFGRILRYVYIKDRDGEGVFVNDYLVREGFARASTYPPDVRYAEQFMKAQEEAREGGRGLWGKCVR